jgi:hypothetical protein
MLREHVLGLAEADPRVVAAAEVGSLTTGAGDRWSDLDLTFGVEDGVAIDEVLEDFTRELVDGHEAVQLFDLPFESTIYRVFLLPGSLQFDLSFTPASEFGRGARSSLCSSVTRWSGSTRRRPLRTSSSGGLSTMPYGRASASSAIVSGRPCT